MHEGKSDWEKQLLVPPHPAAGFSPELRRDIRARTQTAGRSAYVKWAARALAVVAAAIAVMGVFPELRTWSGLTFPRTIAEQELSDAEQRSRALFFGQTLPTLVDRHRFPQRADAFVESDPAPNGEVRLYSEITIGDVAVGGQLRENGNPPVAKVAYRMTVTLLQGQWAGPKRVEMVKDWNTAVDGKPVVSTWTYAVEGATVESVAADDNDSIMLRMK